MNELEGTIKVIGDTTQYGANFRKREFVLTTRDKYPQDIKLEFYQDDCTLLDEKAVGDEIKAFYNLKGNEYKGKYYVNLQAWKLELSENQSEEAESDSPPKKKRGRPKKNPEPQVETEEDLAEKVEELADAPF